MSIHNIVLKQKEYFLSGETLDIDFRIKQLKKLKKAMIKWEPQITEALKTDLGRNEVEAYLCDIGPCILEINEMIRGVKKWSKPETHFSGLLCFPSVTTKVYKKPYGTTLIISPFNFPFMLSIGVLLCAIGGGNTAVIKASSKSSNSTQVLKDMIADTFKPEYVTVIDGGHDIADECLDEAFDKIFYTGSPNIGKHVLEKASKNLTPVALELGGETGNWAIVRKDADIKDAARKIAFFKILNSGQICININQVAVASEVAEEFLSCLKQEFTRQIGENTFDNPEYPKLITSSAYEKCQKDVEKYQDRVIYGGEGNPNKCKFGPTILYPINIDEDIVKRELFNPILCVVPFDDSDIDKIIKVIASRQRGLAFYVFTKDMKWANRVMQSEQFGSGCINEVCVQLMVKGVPFNGVGHSGMGAYHGKWGFMEFTHPCTVLKGSNRFNLSLREHPYSDAKLKLIKLFEK